MERICNRCGCTSFHYNRSRMRPECDLCGTPLSDPQQDQQLMQYDRTYSQAMNHLAAGNWEQTIALLQPLLSEYPAEKRLYLAILRAATQDFIDIRMENTTARDTASVSWDKLLRLDGVTAEMLKYAKKKHENHREELDGQKNRILAWIFAASICSIIAGICFGVGNYFIGIVCLGCLVGCLYKVSHSGPIKVIRQLMSAVPDYHNNPFV